MATMHLFAEPPQFMCNPILDVGSLYIGKEAQHPAIGLCHHVGLIIETPVDLPLGEEQLCPLAFSIKYLGGVSHQFISSGMSVAGAGTSSWWSTASSGWSSCTSRRSTT